MYYEDNRSWQAEILPPQSSILQPCFPLKILHVYHCCSNVSGYQGGPAYCDKAVTNKSDVSRREDSVLQCKVPNMFCKGFGFGFFFFFLHTYKKDCRESREMHGGPFTRGGQGQREGCLLGASLLIRVRESVWELEAMLEPSCSPRRFSNPLLGLEGLLLVCASLLSRFDRCMWVFFFFFSFFIKDPTCWDR